MLFCSVRDGEQFSDKTLGVAPAKQCHYRGFVEDECAFDCVWSANSFLFAARRVLWRPAPATTRCQPTSARLANTTRCCPPRTSTRSSATVCCFSQQFTALTFAFCLQELGASSAGAHIAYKLSDVRHAGTCGVGALIFFISSHSSLAAQGSGLHPSLFSHPTPQRDDATSHDSPASSSSRGGAGGFRVQSTTDYVEYLAVHDTARVAALGASNVFVRGAAIVNRVAAIFAAGAFSVQINVVLTGQVRAASSSRDFVRSRAYSWRYRARFSSCVFHTLRSVYLFVLSREIASAIDCLR